MRVQHHPLRWQPVLSAWGRMLNGHRPLLSIEITRECPLRCPGCHAYYTDHLGGPITLRQLHDLHGEALVTGVLDLIHRHRPLQVSFVGGEPLIRHRELSRILPVVSAQGIHSLVVTSAVIPIPREWNALERVRVGVSIDGLQPEHDARRRPATYDRILANIRGRRVDISLVITAPMVRPGYLDEYLAFWTARPEIGRIRLSLCTPQQGERSPEILTPEARRHLLRQLPALKQRFPALILSRGVIQALAEPPRAPHVCTFAQVSLNYSADLQTRVEPCFFGGKPDCTQCGCAISASLHWLSKKPLLMGLTAGTLLDWTLSVGRLRRRHTGPGRGTAVRLPRRRAA